MLSRLWGWGEFRDGAIPQQEAQGTPKAQRGWKKKKKQRRKTNFEKVWDNQKWFQSGKKNNFWGWTTSLDVLFGNDLDVSFLWDFYHLTIYLSQLCTLNTLFSSLREYYSGIFHSFGERGITNSSNNALAVPVRVWLHQEWEEITCSTWKERKAFIKTRLSRARLNYFIAFQMENIFNKGPFPTVMSLFISLCVCVHKSSSLFSQINTFFRGRRLQGRWWSARLDLLDLLCS